MVSSGSAAGEIRAFLIADVRGYTTFTVEKGDEAAARLASTFAGLIEAAATDAGGRLLELRGDEALVTFSSSRQALRAALAAQRACLEHSARDPSMPIRIGIGIDAGEAVAVLDGYRGKALNLAARLCSLAGIGEILASEALVHLAGRLEGVEFEERGQVQLKGFGDPVTVLGVRAGEPAAAVTAVTAAPAGIAPSPARLPLGAFLGALPSSPLVGREEEAAQLAAQVAEVVGGQGRLVLLAGEPGAGKTRLAQEVFLKARNHGFLLGVGSCLEQRRSVPYYPFLDILGGLATAAMALDQPDPFQGRPQLRHLVAGEGGGAAVGGGGEAEQERLRREVSSFLVELAALRPVAVFVDDLHWADDSTLALLHHLARRCRADSILLVGTYRDVEVGRQHPLERVLREVRRDELAGTVGVRRLAESGTAALIAASFGEEEISAEFAALIHRQTEGNPFFIQQVCRTLVERGDVYQEEGRWGRRAVAEIDLPESIRSTIGERVSRLSAPTQDVLAVAAILGQPFRFPDLLAMTEVGEDALDGALGEAAGIGLLRSGDDDLFSFDHALSQQTLLAEIPPRRRRRLHAQAAQVLAAAGDEGRAAEIAHHFSEGDDPAQAAAWSLIAAERARRVHAHREAEFHFRNAAELATECGDPHLAATARAGQGATLGAIGRLDEGIGTLQLAASHFRETGRINDEAMVLAAIARIHRELTTPQPGIDLITDFLDRADGAADESMATVLAALGRLHWVAGNHEAMTEPAARGAAIATAIGNVGLRIQNDIVLAQSLTHQGDIEGTRDLLAKAFEDSASTTNVVDRVGIANNLAFAYFLLGEFEKNLEFRIKALELAEQFAYSSTLCFAHTMVGQANAFLGRLGAAEESLRRAEAVLAGLAMNRSASYLVAQWAHVKLIQGDLDAFQVLIAGMDPAALESDLQLQTWTAAMRGDALVLGGRAAEALPILRAQVGICRRTGHRLATVLIPLGSALTELGEVDEALAVLGEARGLGISQRDAWVSMESGRSLGVALSARGLWAEADAAFAGATISAEGAPYPYLLHWARLCRARSLQARGESEPAGREAALAAAGLRELGSALLLAQAEELAGDQLVPEAR